MPDFSTAIRVEIRRYLAQPISELPNTVNGIVHNETIETTTFVRLVELIPGSYAT